MNTKSSSKYIPGSSIAFIILCVVWFLEYTGLLSGFF